jgi:hypothetical protein
MTVELRKAVPVTSIIFTYWFEHCLASSFWKDLRESIGRDLWDTLCHAMPWLGRRVLCCHGDSLSFSQERAIGLYPESDESSPHAPIYFHKVQFNIVLTLVS